MNTIKDNIIKSPWCFQSNLITIKKWFKKKFNNIICFAINHDFYVKWIRLSLSLSWKEIKAIAIVNWIFHVVIFFDYLWCILSMVWFY